MMLRASKNVYRMAGPGKLRGATRTDRECYVCGEGHFLDVEMELVCDTCSYSPDGRPTVNRADPWQAFWDEREKYSGFTGRDRVKMVGGFHGAYFDDEGSLRV